MLWAVANEQPNTMPLACAVALAELTRFSSSMTAANSGLVDSIAAGTADAIVFCTGTNTDAVCVAVCAREISGANTSKGSFGK